MENKYDFRFNMANFEIAVITVAKIKIQIQL